jgi:hypothetical protein
MDPKRIVFYLWLPISALLNAISLINLQKDLIPALRAWSSFIDVILIRFANIRDFILYPITQPLSIVFDITIPVAIRSYAIIGFIFACTFVLAARQAQSHDILDDLKKPQWVLVVVLFYPIVAWFMLAHSKSAQDIKLRQLTFWFLMLILFAIMLILFLDFLLKNAA